MKIIIALSILALIIVGWKVLVAIVLAVAAIGLALFLVAPLFFVFFIAFVIFAILS